VYCRFRTVCTVNVDSLCRSCNLHGYASDSGDPGRISITLVAGERRLAIPVGKDRRGFVPPLQERSWSGDSLVVYEFATQAAAPALVAASRNGR
jgi:hypothetical protein